MIRFYLIIINIIIIFLSGCIFNKKENNALNYLDRFNRKMFDFNYQVLDHNITRPLAIIWKENIPQQIRTMLVNFFNNLEEPTTMVNYFIIGNPYKAMIHFNRFFLNTYIGIGGLIDVASLSNAKLIKEDIIRFGYTLGIYDISCGPYIQLPGYGSFTLRNDVGNLIDNLYPILSYLKWWMHLSKFILENIEVRAQLLDSDNVLINSQDKYIIIRTIYFQHNDFLINKLKNKINKNFSNLDIQNNLDYIDK